MNKNTIPLKLDPIPLTLAVLCAFMVALFQHVDPPLFPENWLLKALLYDLHILSARAFDVLCGVVCYGITDTIGKHVIYICVTKRAAEKEITELILKGAEEVRERTEKEIYRSR